MSFTFHEPTTVAEAVALRGEYGDDSSLLAGGAAFAMLWQAGLIRPGHVISLGRIEALRAIRSDEAGLHIGAMATHRAVETTPASADFHPVIADTFGSVATVRIRNQATIGGNLAHADPAHDPPPTLLALGAVVAVANGTSTRQIPLDRFFVDHFTTVLEPTDVLTGVLIPRPDPGLRAVYLRFLPRTRDDYPTVSVAAAVRLDNSGRVGAIRVALGGAAPTPIRARVVEQAVLGRHPTPDLIAAAADSVMDEVDPMSDGRGSAAYKRHVARVWVDRALRKVTDHAA